MSAPLPPVVVKVPIAIFAEVADGVERDGFPDLAALMRDAQDRWVLPPGVKAVPVMTHDPDAATALRMRVAI